jgi:hypothetical protein
MVWGNNIVPKPSKRINGWCGDALLTFGHLEQCGCREMAGVGWFLTRDATALNSYWGTVLYMTLEFTATSFLTSNY